MERDIIHQLLTWKDSPRRKPLILEGARQVGKTTVLQSFGERYYDNTVYLNFEKDELLSGYFKDSLDPANLIQVLSVHKGEPISPGTTLVIFDEIQECPRALNSLKYFCEEANEYHIAAAGSLLGVKTAEGEGFPVGKVNFCHMTPMSFFEYLSAVEGDLVREYLENITTIEPLPEPLHQKYMNHLKTYLFVGGMPEVVAGFVDSGSYDVVREIQTEILSAYERDFSKHAPPGQIMKILDVWAQIPSQLAKENRKFIFSAIRKSARAREYEEAIAWLNNAGIIHKSHRIKSPKLPLSSDEGDQAFKLFLLDVGLLGAKSRLTAKALIEGERLFTEFKGALTENYVAQALVNLHNQPLYYWSSGATAEVDFLVEVDNTIYPLEVKAGKISKNKSLLVYDEKYHPSILSRSTQMNFKHDGRMVNYPLYLVGRLPMESS